MEAYIQKALQGDESAYEHIVREYQNRIFRYVNKMIKDPQEAEDVTQDVFVAGYYNLSKYNKDYSVKTWLYTIAKNLTLNALKKKKRQSTLIDRIKASTNQSTYEEKAYDRDSYSYHVESALKTLSIEEKNLLLLKSVEELDYKELAVIYGVKEATVRKRYERVKKKFKKVYVEKGDENLCQN